MSLATARVETFGCEIVDVMVLMIVPFLDLYRAGRGSGCVNFDAGNLRVGAVVDKRPYLIIALVFLMNYTYGIH